MGCESSRSRVASARSSSGCGDPLQTTSGAVDRGSCGAGSQRPDGDLGLRQVRERAQVRRKFAGHDGLDDMPCFSEPAEQDLGAREHQALHGGVPLVAQSGELLR